MAAAVLPIIGAAAGAGAGLLGRRSYSPGGPTQWNNFKYTQGDTDYTRNPWDPAFSNWYQYAYGPEQDQMKNELRGRTQDLWGDKSRYQDLANYYYGDQAGDSQYYTPGEQEGQRRTYERYGSQTTPEEYANYWLTPEEQQGIGADPWSGLNRFDQATGRMYDDIDTQEGRAFDTLGSTERNTNNLSQLYRQGSRNALDAGAGGLRSAAYAEGLAQDPNYRGSQFAQLGQTGGSVRGLYNDPDILASQDFMQNYKFGPEDTQDLEHLATTGVGTRYQSEVEDINRAAAAQGNTSPMALAAMRERSNRAAAREGADAAVGARTQGRALELDTTKGREDVRLGAAQNRARLGTASELELGQMGLNEGRAAEQMRIAAEQQRRGMQMGAESEIMGSELSDAGNQAKFAAGNEQANADRRLNTYGQYGQMRNNATQFSGQVGSDLASRADAEASRRASEIANNRQAAQRTSANQRYQQGRETANDMAGVEKQIADQRLGFNQERRGYYAGAAQGAQSGALTSSGQQTGFYGTRGGLANNAVGNYLNYDIARRRAALEQSGQPSNTDRVLGGAVGGLLGASGGQNDIYRGGG